MGVLFGTDGIRGVAGEPPLDRETVYRTGLSLTRVLKRAGGPPLILIARDTRISGLWIERLLQRAIADAGGTSEACGVLSTPAVSFLTARTEARAGIMISASHNPYQDNGIKIFSSGGIKFNDETELELETEILASTEKAPPDFTQADDDGLPVQRVVEKYRDLYGSHLISSLPPGFRLDGMRLVVDCAHGALSAIAPEFLSRLGAEVLPIHCRPDGRNINDQAGALHLEALQNEVVLRQAQLGIAFDGDADRAMFVDGRGLIRDGDDVIYLLARYADSNGAPPVVVGTVMANLGLELALEELGIRLIRTSVGDRYVLEEMLRLGAVIGGEQSGHIILTRLASTGDGLLTALKVLEILRQEKKDIAELCMPVKRFPQVLLNVPVPEKVPFAEIDGLASMEAACKEKLGSRCRILLRYSGTEKLARVMVEGEDAIGVADAARRLASVFAKIGART